MKPRKPEEETCSKVVRPVKLYQINTDITQVLLLPQKKRLDGMRIPRMRLHQRSPSPNPSQLAQRRLNRQLLFIQQRKPKIQSFSNQRNRADLMMRSLKQIATALMTLLELHLVLRAVLLAVLKIRERLMIAKKRTGSRLLRAF